jgi:hypothetical protein
MMVGSGDFISAGAVAVWVGEQRSESERGGGFTYAVLMLNTSGSSVPVVSKPRGLVDRNPEC